MTFDKHSAFDHKMSQLLRQYDPAGTISPIDCARLEMSIAARIANQPQATRAVNISDDFVVPRLLAGAISFPATLLSVMMMGLMLGFFVSSLAGTGTAAPKYTITTAMAEPWHQFTP
jgi:hypothetical protein